MKPILSMLLLLVLFGLPAGCDDPSAPRATRISVTYEIDRKFQWDPAEKKFSGTILIKNRALTGKTPLSANSYGITFRLTPGERTTIIIKTDEEGTYCNGEFNDLPVQLPLLMSRQRPEVFGECFDYDIRAVCELELSPEPIDNKYYLIFNCYDVQSMWLFATSFELPAGQPLDDGKFATLSAGTQEFERVR